MQEVHNNIPPCVFALQESLAIVSVGVDMKASQRRSTLVVLQWLLLSVWATHLLTVVSVLHKYYYYYSLYYERRVSCVHLQTASH